MTRSNFPGFSLNLFLHTPPQLAAPFFPMSRSQSSIALFSCFPAIELSLYSEGEGEGEGVNVTLVVTFFVTLRLASVAFSVLFL